MRVGNGKKVYIAMSGGVDSSVAAALLVEAGYDVTGVFIKTWHPDFLPCTWRDERRDAMRVAAKLGIPFATVDLEKVYKRDVADYMIREYEAGRTPNPDVMCNKHVKFGALYEWARREGADYIAAGHYARTATNNLQPTNYDLLAGKDENKDQSYFLWTLPQEVLAHTLFPIGNLTKPEVRTEALKRGLHTAEKKDSQGICFLGQIELREFLSRYIDEKPGMVLDESGRAIGTHSGARFYTLGQRHGFDVRDKSPTDGPHYVVAKDTAANVLTVSPEFKIGDRFGVKDVMITDVHWISDQPETGKCYSARIRYRQPLQSCRVEKVESSRWNVVFDEPQKAAAPGQSIVVYEGETVVGGGIIE